MIGEGGREADNKGHPGNAEVKSEANPEKEEPVLRTSSRQRKPTARFFEMMEMEKRSKVRDFLHNWLIHFLFTKRSNFFREKMVRKCVVKIE